MFSKHSESFVQVLYVLGRNFTFYHHVVYIGFYIPTQLGLKHSCHYFLVDGSCVFQPKGHHPVMIVTKGSPESFFFLVSER